MEAPAERKDPLSQCAFGCFHRARRVRHCQKDGLGHRSHTQKALAASRVDNDSIPERYQQQPWQESAASMNICHDIPSAISSVSFCIVCLAPFGPSAMVSSDDAEESLLCCGSSTPSPRLLGGPNPLGPHSHCQEGLRDAGSPGGSRDRCHEKQQ